MNKFYKNSIAVIAVIALGLVFSPIAVKQASAANAEFSKGEALVMALNEYSGDGMLSSLKLERIDGEYVYSVEFLETEKKVDVQIDAKTGETLDVVETDITEGQTPSESDLNSVIDVLGDLISFYENNLGN